MNLQQLPKQISLEIPHANKNFKMDPSEFTPLSHCEYCEDQMNMRRFVENNNSAWCLNE